MNRILYVFMIVLLAVLISLPVLALKKVEDLKYHHMQNYCWMRLAEIVPEITDRVILSVTARMGVFSLLSITSSCEKWKTFSGMGMSSIELSETAAVIK